MEPGGQVASSAEIFDQDSPSEASSSSLSGIRSLAGGTSGWYNTFLEPEPGHTSTTSVTSTKNALQADLQPDKMIIDDLSGLESGYSSQINESFEALSSYQNVAEPQYWHSVTPPSWTSDEAEWARSSSSTELPSQAAVLEDHSKPEGSRELSSGYEAGHTPVAISKSVLQRAKYQPRSAALKEPREGCDCGLTFKSHRDLDRHRMYTCKSRSRALRFHCSCGKSYTRRDIALRHISTAKKSSPNATKHALLGSVAAERQEVLPWTGTSYLRWK